MKKFAIAILLSAGTLVSIQAHARDRAFIGAVDGAFVGSYVGGAHGAVTGAIIGAVVGSSSENYYDHRGQVRYEREYRHYQPEPVYYVPQAFYQPYYEPRYEVRYPPRRVVYAESPVYESYSLPYVSYRTRGHIGHHASHHRGHHAPQRGHRDHRGRY